MAVIKAHSASALLKEAIVLDLGDLGRQAARLQAATEAKARQIIGDAQREAARLIEDARSKGFDEGKTQGLERGLTEGREQGRAAALQQAAEQLKKLQQTWLEAAQEWEANRARLEREGPQRVLELALHLGEKLVHRVIQVDPSVVVDQVASALGHVLREIDVTVRVCPQDRPELEKAMPELLTEFSHLKHVQIVDDPQVGPGGCVIVYGQGRIDATIDTQLRRVVELMLPEEKEDSA